MTGGRLFEPQAIDEAAIAAVVERGRTPVIQYSRPAYPDAVLEQVDRACARFGEALEVRFFAHRGEPFDAKVLRKIPHVANLSLDTLSSIDRPEIVGELEHLRRLRFGVYLIDDPSVLSLLGVGRLRRLSLAENKKRNFDLAPLAGAEQLTHLFVQGHAKNIEAVGGLAELADLSLSGFPSSHDLTFANRIAGLRRLLLILGSRTSIEEFEHPRIERLRIVWVKTLAALGSLARFPGLRELVVEDQLHLSSLDVSGTSLERLRISNCKNLSRLEGLTSLDRLQVLSIDRTRLDLEALAEQPWPQTMRAVALLGGGKALYRRLRDRLDARGYAEFAPADRVE